MPISPEKSAQEIQDRLAQIDKEHFQLTENLNRVSAPFQESTQGDQDAIESQFADNAFGDVRQQIEKLERERDELHIQLEQLKKAA